MGEPLTMTYSDNFMIKMENNIVIQQNYFLQ